MTTPTDWNTYYRRPAAAARFTRRITERLLLSLIASHAPRPLTHICELGGANSCFHDAIRRAHPDSRYTVVDNNTYGLELLRARPRAIPPPAIVDRDIRTIPDGFLKADLVFSVGLVEHFTPAETALVIQKHFSLLAPAGLAIITFPTPTLPYRVTRTLAERLGLWAFPDERPLQFPEVLAAVAPFGTVRARLVNWPIVLTQGVVVVGPR